MYRKSIQTDHVFSYKYPEEEITDAEAKRYFQELMESIPFALRWLKAYISESSDVKADQLDYSSESLKLVWKWYIQRVNVMPCETEYTSSFACDKSISPQISESLQQVLLHFAPKKKLTGESRETLVAISLYYAQTLIHSHNCLRWEIRKEKDYLHNRPVIAGFVDMYNARFRPVYDPYQVCAGLAAHIVTGIHSADDLYNHYSRVSADIPE